MQPKRLDPYRLIHLEYALKVATQALPTIPRRDSLVNPAMKAGTVKAVQGLFPIEGSNVKVEAANVRIDDSKFDPDGLNAWQDARQGRQTLGGRIVADLTLSRDGKVVQTLKSFNLGSLPLMGALGTMMVGGNDYFTPMQLRLKPGAYTRQKTNGEFETFILMKGGQLKVFMDPETGIFKIGVWDSTVSWYAIVRALGATDDQIVDTWGGDKKARELLAVNQTKAREADVEKFFKSVVSHKQNKELIRAGIVEKDTEFDNVDAAGQVAAIKTWLSSKELDPYVTKRTLGHELSHAGLDVLLLASKRILGVQRGAEEPDDRDNVEFKTLHHVDDMIPARITKMTRMLQRRVQNRLLKPTATLAQAFGTGWLNGATVGFYGGRAGIEGGLANTAEAANPLAILSENSKVTLKGEGGIKDDTAITNEARLFRPGSAGFIDSVHTPEGSEIGVTTHLAVNAIKDGDKMKSLFYKVENGKIGKLTWLDTTEANSHIVGYPEYWNVGKGEDGKPKAAKVRANVDGEITVVPASEVEYVIPSGRAMFDHASNSSLFFDHTHANRGMMSGKHITQALPLINRELPLVNMTDGFGTAMGEVIGDYFVIRSKVAGKVEKVTKKEIVVAGVKHELFDNYPMQAKVAIDHVPVVKVGDVVKKGQLLADSNYSREGKLALGVNVRSAYMPWKNALNFEDAIAISESAAKKFTSLHVHRESIDLEPDIKVDKKLAYAQFPTKFTKDSFAKLDDKGIIKNGSSVVPGDVLVAAVQKTEVDSQDRTAKNLGNIHKALLRPYKDRMVVWTEDFPGVVKRVLVRDDHIEVHLQTEEPARVGDKLSMSSAAKGTISAVIPDHEMPQTADKKHIEVILNPHGIVNRMNPSQTIESAAGKLVRDGKGSYSFANFDGRDHAKEISDALDKKGLSHSEKLFDPQTGKWIERPVAVGYNYMFKLDHPVRKKFSARERDSYTMDETPTRGAGKGGQSFDHLTTYALLGHDAHAILSESAGIRGTKNDEFWHAYQAGEQPPPPKVPFAFEKFRTFLNAAGVDTQKKGNTLHYMPMTEKRVRALSNGKVENASIIRSKDLAEEAGGLYDVETTGGLKGEKWAHIELDERVPHPLYEKTLRDITGLKQAEFYGLIMHSRWYDPKTGKIVDEPGEGRVTGEAAFKHVLDFNVDSKIRDLRQKLRTAVGSDANKYNRAVRYLRGLKTSDLDPFEAYMTKTVPVIPPKFRPIIEMSGGALRVADSNLLYRDLLLTTKSLADAKSAGLPKSMQTEARKHAYEAFGALIGVNNPLTHRDDREDASGFIDIIKGKRNKEGLFQRLVVAHRNDYSGRSTIEPDSNLGVDEISIPEDMAWKIYKPSIVRRMSQGGWQPAEAAEQVEKRTLAARQALDAEMKERPVLYNRAPTLHRWGIAAAMPRISEGKEVKISPLVCGPFNADYDGDTMSIFTPITDAAKNESFKLLPSKNLIYDRNKGLAYGVSKDIISGIFALTSPGSPSGKSYKTAADAIDAYRNNKDSLQMGSLVKIEGNPNPIAVGWLMFEEIVPKRFLAGISAPITGKKLDKLLERIATDSPADYNLISRRISQAGFEFAAAAGGITSSIKELVVDRSKINRLLTQLDNEVRKGSTIEERRKIFSSKQKAVSDQLTDIMKKHLEETNEGYHSFVVSESNKKIDQMKQVLATPLAVTDVNDKLVPNVITSSYAGGMSPSDYVMVTPGARKGLVARSRSTALPGFLAKEVAGNVGDIRVMEKDCGTKVGIDEPLNEADVDLLDRHLLNDVAGFKRNDPITPHVLSVLRDKGLKDVMVRSPMTCKSLHVPCQMCAGRDAQGKLHPIGSNIGYNYGQSVSERSTQLIMKAFHSGGTIGSGDSLTDGFARLKDLLSTPEQLKDQGVLAQVAGTVSDKRIAPQGGYYVTVRPTSGPTVEHYVPANRNMKVNVGDRVTKGQPITDGNYRPQEIAALQGGLAAQRYVVNDIRKSYEAAGATVRKPVIEVLAAGLMRTVEITDDGGEPSISVGDVMHENEFNALHAKNSKIEAKPVLLGLSHKPLESKDLLARLNFQRLDDSIRDVSSSAGSSDLTGSASPIAGLAYGATFRPAPLFDSAFHKTAEAETGA